MGLGVLRWLRLENRWDLLVDQLLDVDVFQPRVRHHFLPASLRAQSFVLVLVQQLVYEVLAIIRKFDWLWMNVRRDEVDTIFLNHIVHLLVSGRVVFNVEGREADNHLVGQDAQCPPIDWERVALLGYHLR